MILSKTPLNHPDDDAFLGFVVQDAAGWQAQTIFGYTIARVESQQDAESALREQGLKYLTGVWQYYDKEDYDWYPCILKEANEHHVTVIRTNALGFQDPDDYKMVTLKDPTDQVLIKSH